MRLIFLVSLQLGILTALHAQSGFYRETIDLRQPENALLIPPETENLGKILLQGFSKGELRAYQSLYTEEPVDWAEPDPLSRWDSKTDYYFDDMVEYDGRDYVVMMESRGKVPTDNNYWAQIDRKIPVKFKYELPGLKDTLSAGQFLRNMVYIPEQNIQEWDKNVLYFFSDLVWYQGAHYEPLEENKGIAPTDSKYWVQTSRRSLSFSSFSDIQTLQLLYYYKVTNGDTVRIPQMLSLIVSGFDVNKHVASFYFKDVLQYLSTTRSPILYRSKYGYLKPNRFLACVDCKYELAKFIRENLKAGKLILDPQKISDKLEYDKWIADDDVNLAEAYQINNNVISIYGSKVVSDTELKPFLIAEILVNKVIALFPNYLDECYTYESALKQLMFTGQKEFINLELSSPIEKKVTTSPPKKPSRANLFVNFSTGLSELKIEQSLVVKEIWKSITESQSTEGRITTTPLRQEYFELQLDLKKIKNWKSYEGSQSSFNFKPPFRRYDVTDSIPNCNDIKKFSVCFKDQIDLTTFQSIKKEPVFLTFQVGCNESQSPATYSFRFSDIERILKSTENSSIFLQDLMAGTFKWNDTELIYGLIEEK